LQETEHNASLRPSMVPFTPSVTPFWLILIAPVSFFRKTIMNSFKSMYAAVAIAMVVFGKSRGSVVAFVVPNYTRAKIGGDSTAIAESEFKSMRMSEADFRLDYIQGVRHSYNNKAPAIEPVEDKNENIHDDVAYGHDSTCYRGLTNPSNAGLVLAFILASGMVVASPEIHISLPSLSVVLEGTRHLMGDDAASGLGALVERMAFRWDISGLPRSFHQISDQVVASFDVKLVPFATHQRDQWQEALGALPSRFDELSAHIASQSDALQEDVMSKMTSVETTIGQALAYGKSYIAQHSSDLQLASHAKIDQWQHDLVQTSGHLQGGLSQGLDKGRELLVEKSSNFQDTILLKTSEFQEASRMNMNQMKGNALQMNEQVRVLANQYSTEMKDISQQKYDTFQEATTTKLLDMQQGLLDEVAKVQEETNIVVDQKYSGFQQLSETAMNEAGKDATQLTENIRTMFANAGADFEMKRKEIGSSNSLMIQDSGQLLHDKMMALRDTSFIEWNKVQDQLAFQQDASMDAIGHNLHKWKDSTANQWYTFQSSMAKQVGSIDSISDIIHKWKESSADQFSSFEGAMANHVASIGRREDAMATESAFLKTIIEEIVG